MFKAHKIKLYPTKNQETFFRKSAGVARFAHNWALERWQGDYKNGIKQSGYDLRKKLNAIKRSEFPWMYEVGKCAADYGVLNVEVAYKKMWKEKAGYPKFKKKGGKDSFVSNQADTFKQKDSKIWISRLGWVKCAENLRFEGKVNSVTISRKATTWFAAINIETPESIPTLKPAVGENQAIVGIDLGIKTMMTLSDGTTFENPKALKRSMRRLKILSRRHSKKQKDGSNRRRALMILAKEHYKVSCIRSTAIHQMTASIFNKYDKIVIEDLDAVSMYKHKGLSKQLADVSFGEIKRQLKYKAEWRGKEFILADKYFPSSKTCSSCGAIKEKLKLSERTYKCETCGLSMDRDLNAARNLAVYSPTAKYAESHASGAVTEALLAGNTVAMNEESRNVILEINEAIKDL